MSPATADQGSQSQERPADAAPAPDAPTGTVFGTLRLSTGERPTGAQIVIGSGAISPQDDRWAKTTMTLEVGADGWFRKDGLAAGKYRLLATLSGYARNETRFAISAERGAGPLDILLTTGGGLRVRVLDGSGTPVIGRHIVVERASEYGGGTAMEGVTEGAGDVLFEHLEPGVYSVERRTLDTEPVGESRVTSVVEGRVALVTFDGACGLYGSVVDWQGMPMRGVMVALHPEEQARPEREEFYREGYKGLVARARTDDAGKYRFEGLPAGNYRATLHVVEGSAYSTSPPETIILTAGEPTEHDFKIEGASLSGRVVTREGGDPPGPAEATVTAARVQMKDGSVVERDPERRVALTDEQGGFLFGGLPPGSYEIEAAPRDPRWQSRRDVVEVVEGVPPPQVVMELEARKSTSAVRLVVSDADTHKELVGFQVAVVVRSEDGRQTLRTPASTAGSPGTVDVHLDPGQQTLRVFCAGYLPEDVNVALEEGKVLEQPVALHAVAESGESK